MKAELNNHISNTPSCNTGTAHPHYFQCSTCRSVFASKHELTTHLNINLHCKTIPAKFRKPLFTPELNDLMKKTTLREPAEVSRHLLSNPVTTRNITGEDDTLLGVMESAMRKAKPRKSGLESSILSMVAEDEDLVAAYSRLPVDPATGKKKLNKDMVESATSKAKIDVETISELISRAEVVTLCFVLDTTGSMASHISGVKEQIVEIVRQVQGSGCYIAGLAFVGYKDWCDGMF